MYSHTHVQQQLKRFFLNKNAEAGQLIEKIRERERERDAAALSCFLTCAGNQLDGERSHDHPSLCHSDVISLNWSPASTLLKDPQVT